MGIKKSEIDRIFDKGFTGTNGRNQKKSTGIGLYNIDGKSSLVYVSPREIKSNETRTYSNKTYEYTHGYGAIITSASTTNENRDIKVFTKFI